MQSNAANCNYCGSVKIAEGSIFDASFEAKIPWKRFVLSASLPMMATACLDCGNVVLRVDPNKLHAILGERDSQTQ